MYEGKTVILPCTSLPSLITSSSRPPPRPSPSASASACLGSHAPPPRQRERERERHGVPVLRREGPLRRRLPPLRLPRLKHVVAAMIALKGLGGLLFILSSSLGAYLLLLHLAFITPVVHDFYNYDIESAEFVQLFTKFAQNCALVGPLPFFLAMKNSIPKRQPNRKKAPKPKAN